MKSREKFTRDLLQCIEWFVIEDNGFSPTNTSHKSGFLYNWSKGLYHIRDHYHTDSYTLYLSGAWRYMDFSNLYDLIEKWKTQY